MASDTVFQRIGLASLLGLAVIVGEAPAPAQTTAPTAYLYEFPGVPQSALCELDLVNTAGVAATVRVQSYDGGGGLLADVSQHLAANGASRANLSDLSGDQRSSVRNVVVTSTFPNKGLLTCTTLDARGHTSGYSLHGIEFRSQSTSFLRESPALALARDPASPVTWTNMIVVGVPDQNITLYASTGQLDPATTNAADHTVHRSVARNSVQVYTLDDLLPLPVLRNSTDGALTAIGPDTKTPINIAAYQVFQGTNGAAFALRWPSEEAARMLYFPHVFSPPAGQASEADWRNVLVLKNATNLTASVYLTASDSAGKQLGDVVVTVGPSQSFAAMPQTIFKDLPGLDRVAMVQARSNVPVNGAELFSYLDASHREQTVAVTAATNLDLGTKLLAMRAQGGYAQVSSYAIINPGARDEPVQAQAVDGSGKVIGTSTFTIPRGQRYTGSIFEVFPGVDVSTASYVLFQTTSPPSDPTLLDMQHPVGRIAGIIVNADFAIALFVESTNMQNLDPLQANIETSNYNPRTGNDIIEFFDNAPVITGTVRTANLWNINNFTFDPVGKGKLTQGMSATLPTQANGRQYSGTIAAVNGPKHSNLIYLDGPDFDPLMGSGVALSTGGGMINAHPLLTINITDEKAHPQTTTFKTSMTFQDRASAGYDVNRLNGSGSAVQLTKQNIPSIAYIVAVDPGAVDQSGTPYNIPYSTVVSSLTESTTPNAPDALMNVIIDDSISYNNNAGTPINRFFTSQANATGFFPIYFPVTSAGNDAMKRFKQIYQVGPHWYHTPPAGTTLTLPTK